MGSGILDATSYALNVHALAPVTVGALIAGMGVFVLIRERVSTVSMAFCGMTTCGAVWLVAYGGVYCAIDRSLALTWGRIENAAVVFIPSVVYLFTLAVTNSLYRSRVGALASFALSALFCFAVLFTGSFLAGLRTYFWGPYPRYGWLTVPFLAFFFGMMALSLRQLYARGYRVAPFEIHRRRLRAFLVAFSIAYLGSVDYLPAYGVPVYPLGCLAVLAFLVIVSRAIWRYPLLEITPAFAANQILRTMSDALLVVDRDGVIRLANQAACRLFEIPEQGLVGRPVWTIHGGLFPRGKLQTFIRTSVVHGYEVSCQTPQGGELTLDVSASGIRDRNGRPMAVVCILRDVTQRRQREEELRRAHGELKRSHEELKAAQMNLIQSAKLESVGRLAAGVAHEVKNPLAVVLQGFDYLHRVLSRENADVGAVVDNGREAVRRADKVIRGLLDYASTRSLEIRDENLNEIIGKALLLVKHEMGRGGIRVREELQEPLPTVPVDANRIEQVFVNILMNAVQATPRGGTLTVRTRAVPAQGNGGPGEAAVVAEVEDTGAGIPPEALARIFEPFFTTKPAGAGTGLGLAVCKNIIEMHGGTIAVGNRVERSGAQVILSFRTRRPAGEAVWAA
ncbi:MAG: PAS domain S-box protein [Candidatus Omnitrophica bacterium]|nr:PAS domain S-box protein [Candidatus Omnitrophota bacterium]